MPDKRDSIVFINQNSGYLMVDVIQAHRQKFSEVVLITGKLILRDKPLDATIKVEKIVEYDRSSTVKRLFTWFFGFLQILFLVLTKYRESELYIVTNPPFATFLPLFCRNKFNILVFDVYPDALVQYNILKEGSFLIRIWKKANRKVYKLAKRIFTLSEGMKTLLEKYVDNQHIKVVNVWTDNAFLKPIPKDENPFVLNHNFQGKFLVMYSGNLGYTHDLEVLIECAKKVSNSRIIFVIIGEGEKKKLLREKIKENQLENCTLLPWQDVSVLPYSLAAADIGVVSLDKKASLLSVPSKTYNLMSVGAPLLCIANNESELARLVGKYHLGKCFNSDDIQGMVDFIEDLALNPEARQSISARAVAASREFGAENVFELVV